MAGTTPRVSRATWPPGSWISFFLHNAPDEVSLLPAADLGCLAIFPLSVRIRSAGKGLSSPMSESTAAASHMTAEPRAASSESPVISKSSSTKTKVSIVIPVYNEEATVQELIKLVVLAPLPPGCDREIICVNDCSTDGTAKRLDELPKLFEGNSFKIFHKSVNEGKGAALRDGFKHAGGDIVLVQDADLEYDPEDYPKLLWPIVENKADVVYGSRFIGEP